MRRGDVIVVDDDPLKARTISRQVKSALSIEPVVLGGFRDLKDYVHPPSDRLVARRRINALVLDFLLNRERTETAVDVIEWLQRVYPRTPLLVYTGCTIAEVAAACRRHRRVVVVPVAEISPEDWERESDVLQRAMLGLLRIPGEHEIPIVGSISLGAELLRYCHRRFFEPWDSRCIAIRRWLLDAAKESAQHVKEYHLCTLDAYFDSLAEDELPNARGVKAPTIRQNIKEIRSLWRVVDIDVLKSRWERSTCGRAPREGVDLPWRSNASSPAAAARPPAPRQG